MAHDRRVCRAGLTTKFRLGIVESGAERILGAPGLRHAGQSWIVRSAALLFVCRLVLPGAHLPASESLPDCPFVEGAAVIVGNKAAKAAMAEVGAAPKEGGADAIGVALLQLLGLEVIDVATECEGATVDGAGALRAQSRCQGPLDCK